MGIIENSDLDSQIKQLKEQKNSIVFTNGCFDLLHKGHIDLLNKASTFGDILIVGLNSDNSVKTLKGQDRPIENEITRSKKLLEISNVDFVIIFNSETPIVSFCQLHVHFSSFDIHSAAFFPLILNKTAEIPKENSRIYFFIFSDPR